MRPTTPLATARLAAILGVALGVVLAVIGQRYAASVVALAPLIYLLLTYLMEHGKTTNATATPAATQTTQPDVTASPEAPRSRFQSDLQRPLAPDAALSHATVEVPRHRVSADEITEYRREHPDATLSEAIASIVHDRSDTTAEPASSASGRRE